MKLRISILPLGLAIAKTALFAISAAAETEPNNTRAQANALTLNASGHATSSGKISPLSDLDLFSILTPGFSGQTNLTISMTPTAADQALDAKIQLADIAGNILAEINSGGDNASETLIFKKATGNTQYFIACQSADRFSSGLGDYVLQVGLGDLNDQISEAIVLGSMDQTRSRTGTIDSPTDVDIWAVDVQAGQRISFDIDQTSAGFDSYIRLFDPNGMQLAANNDAQSPSETNSLNSYLDYTFTNSGTFYVGVSGYGNTNYNAVTGSGDLSGSIGLYTLVASPGLAGTTHRTSDSTSFPMDILRFGSVPQGINPNQRTWVIIHGRNSSRTNENIFALANSLFQARPGDQVLTLDWKTAANTSNIFDAEDSIVPVARWAAVALANYGFPGTNLNLVGHSFGSYVADEIAKRIPGGVDTIIGLDPAEDVLLADYHSNDSANFSLHSLFSWTFYSSADEGLFGYFGANYGNEETPTTADESFVVNNTTHDNVVFLFAYMLTHPLDPISQHFSLNLLLAGVWGPWSPDQLNYGGATNGLYEAVITAGPSGTTTESIHYVTNAPILNITSHATGATVTSSPTLLSGTATDAGRGDSGIASVHVDGVRTSNDTVVGAGVARWNLNVNLSVGTNIITVVARDSGGQKAATTNVVTINYNPPSLPLPVLEIASANGSVMLSWRVDYSNFALQQADNLNSPDSWNTVPVLPTIVGSSNVVTLPISEENRFFRLNKP